MLAQGILGQPGKTPVEDCSRLPRIRARPTPVRSPAAAGLPVQRRPRARGGGCRRGWNRRRAGARARGRIEQVGEIILERSHRGDRTILARLSRRAATKGSGQAAQQRCWALHGVSRPENGGQVEVLIRRERLKGGGSLGGCGVRSGGGSPGAGHRLLFRDDPADRGQYLFHAWLASRMRSRHGNLATRRRRHQAS